MKAGKLKSRIELFEPHIERDEYGAEKIRYTKTSLVYAERVKLSGRMLEQVGERFSSYSVRFSIRDAHRVDEHWRLRQIGRNNHFYEVTNILPNPDRGMLTLICERINE